MKTLPATFPCDELTLEGEWLLPEGAGPFPTVVVCHPYPPAGGNMRNNVVAAICEALAGQSLAAFRFNFRGVGNSQGSFSEGNGEQEDVRAALDYAASSKDADSGRLGLSGYSFGGMMAFRVGLKDARVRSLAVVSSPLTDENWQQLRDFGHPRLYLVGDADQMIPAERFISNTKDAPAGSSFHLIKGADHSLSGFEEEVGRIVSRFFSDNLAAPRA